MRSEAYVSRLLETAKNPKADPDTLVRIMEGAIRQIAAAGPNGEKAMAALEHRVLKRAVRKLDA